MNRNKKFITYEKTDKEDEAEEKKTNKKNSQKPKILTEHTKQTH